MQGRLLSLVQQAGSAEIAITQRGMAKAAIAGDIMEGNDSGE
jgi:hypothetical protein